MILIAHGMTLAAGSAHCYHRGWGRWSGKWLAHQRCRAGAFYCHAWHDDSRARPDRRLHQCCRGCWASGCELGPDNFGVIGLGKVAGIPVALMLLVVLSVLAYFLLSHTRLGRYTYAIGSNQEAARLSGIPVKKYLVAVYVLLGLLTGLAGMIAVSRLGIGEPNFGIGLELDVIAATVVGGASLFGGQGTIVGTLIGVFLIGLIRDGSVLLDVNSFTQNVIIGVVIWLAVFWDQFRRRRISSLYS